MGTCGINRQYRHTRNNIKKAPIISRPITPVCNIWNIDIDPDILTTAALVILLFSIRDEYTECCICLDRMGSLITNPCQHTLICTKCYIPFCVNFSRCSLCREKLNINDPFRLYI